MTTVVEATGNSDIDALLWGWKWDMTTFNYSFPTSTAEYSHYAAVNGFQAFNATQQVAVGKMFDNIESFTTLTFNLSTAPGATFRFAEADSINYTNDPAVSTYTGLHSIGSAEANPPELPYNGVAPQSAAFAQGDSWYNHSHYNNPLLGSFGYAAGLMHETGHNLGLKHGHNTQSGHGTTFPALPFDHNSYEYSVMTYSQYPGYTGVTDNAPDHPTTFMMNDIAALQYMYGANFNYNNSTTIYSWSTTTGELFINGAGQGAPTGAPGGNLIFMTIWDGGGVDTYDFSNYSSNLNASLMPGSWTATGITDQIANLGTDSGGVAHYARGSIANAMLYQGDTRSLIENAIGGSGNDTIYGNDGDNSLTGMAGNDSLYGFSGFNLLSGNGGQDYLKGGGAADQLFGGDENDTLKGGGGADLLDGGDGIDTATYEGSGAAVTVALGGTGSGGSAQGDTLTAVENLTGSTYNDVLIGNGQTNVLIGDTGNDRLDGGGDLDVLRGNAGNDTYIVDNSGDSVIELADQGTDIVYSKTSYILPANQSIETLQLDVSTGSQALNITGNGLGNVLTGNAGANVLNGGGGADLMQGGSGNDSYVVDHAGDVVKEAGGTTGGNDMIVSTVSYALATGQYVENLQFASSVGSASLNLSGNETANSLLGNGGNNALQGGSGADTLTGAGGRDILVPGNDTHADIIRFNAISDSTGGNRDQLLSADFNNEDKLAFAVKPTVFAGTVTTGALNNGANFNIEIGNAVNGLLNAGGAVEAVLFDPNSGGLNQAGYSYLVVDANNDGSYTANNDYLVELVNFAGTLDATDFI